MFLTTDLPPIQPPGCWDGPPRGYRPPPFFFSKTTHMWVQKEKHLLPAGAWLPLCKPVYGSKVKVGVAQLSELNRSHTCIPSPSP